MLVKQRSVTAAELQVRQFNTLRNIPALSDSSLHSKKMPDIVPFHYITKLHAKQSLMYVCMLVRNAFLKDIIGSYVSRRRRS
jgi:hypothetical protein